MVEYKSGWERAIAEAIARGQEPPTPIPHPDDIIIDLPNARAVTCGPSTNEEKERWDQMLEYLDEIHTDVSYHAAAYKKARSPDKKVDGSTLVEILPETFQPTE